MISTIHTVRTQLRRAAKPKLDTNFCRSFIRKLERTN